MTLSRELAASGPIPSAPQVAIGSRPRSCTRPDVSRSETAGSRANGGQIGVAPRGRFPRSSSAAREMQSVRGSDFSTESRPLPSDRASRPISKAVDPATSRSRPRVSQELLAAYEGVVLRRSRTSRTRRCLSHEQATREHSGCRRAMGARRPRAAAVRPGGHGLLQRLWQSKASHLSGHVARRARRPRSFLSRHKAVGGVGRHRAGSEVTPADPDITPTNDQRPNERRPAMRAPGEFLSDIKEIRRRARQNRARARHAKYGGKAEDAVALLNHAVATKSSVSSPLSSRRLRTGPPARRSRKSSLAREGGRKHMDFSLNGHQLGGQPNLTGGVGSGPTRRTPRANNGVDMLKENLVAERSPSRPTARWWDSAIGIRPRGFCSNGFGTGEETRTTCTTYRTHEGGSREVSR